MDKEDDEDMIKEEEEEDDDILDEDVDESHDRDPVDTQRGSSGFSIADIMGSAAVVIKAKENQRQKEVKQFLKLAQGKRVK